MSTELSGTNYVGWDDDPFLDNSQDEAPDLAENEKFEQPISLLGLLDDGYAGQDPEVLREIKAVTGRVKSVLTAQDRQKLDAQLRQLKVLICGEDTNGYPSAPDIVELGWVVASRAVYECCFHPEIHCSRYGNYLNLATLIGGLGDEPRLCLNILRADAWREQQRNEIFLKDADPKKRERYLARIFKRTYRSLQFMYWETGLPIGLEVAQISTKFDWQSPQFQSIRDDKYAVLSELHRRGRAYDLFHCIEQRSNKLRQERPYPASPDVPSWSACRPEYADRSFSTHTQDLIERQKQRTVAQSRYDWDEY